MYFCKLVIFLISNKPDEDWLLAKWRNIVSTVFSRCLISPCSCLFDNNLYFKFRCPLTRDRHNAREGTPCVTGSSSDKDVVRFRTNKELDFDCGFPLLQIFLVSPCYVIRDQYRVLITHRYYRLTAFSANFFPEQ